MMENATNITSFNGTGAFHCWYIRCTFTDAERYLIIVFFFAVFGASLAGNSALVTSILWRRKKKKHWGSLSTINLAVADLLITIFCAPTFTVDMYITEQWVFGLFGLVMCKLVSFIQNVAVVASMLNLAVISAEKFLAVCMPFGFYLRRKIVKFLSPFAWLFAIGEAAYFVNYKTVKEFQGSAYCQHDGLTPSHVIAQVCLFFVPLFLIITFQMITINKLKTGNRSFGGENAETAGMTSIRKKRETKAVRILFFTMVTFVVCWTPLQLLALLVILGKGPKGFRETHIVYAVCMWLFFSNAAIHPLVYWFMTERGQRKLQAVLASMSTRVSSASVSWRLTRRSKAGNDGDDLRQVAELQDTAAESSV